MLKDYYQLTKPGIIYGNAITVTAGFFLASRGHIDWALFFWTLMGISLVMASGCVINNYFDRDIDSKMERTKRRALVRGTILPENALFFGKILAVIGLTILYINTNTLTVSVAVGGLFVYVVLYTKWLKRTSTFGTLIGSISGAVPPVVGYLAVSNSLDLGVILLFLILMLWQMPHSFAIAIYRFDDYRNAEIQVLPVKRGIQITKIQTILYIAVFIPVALALAVFGYTGYVYYFFMLTATLLWLAYAIVGLYKSPVNDKKWARMMFAYSIFLLIIFSVLLIFSL